MPTPNELLREGLQRAPRAAALHYTLGLTLVRLGRHADALGEFREAARLAPDDARFAYVYAVSLNSAGKSAAALAEIDRALVREPDNHDLLIAAITFRRDRGDLSGARPYALRLFERYPDDRDAAQLLHEIGEHTKPLIAAPGRSPSRAEHRGTGKTHSGRLFRATRRQDQRSESTRVNCWVLWMQPPPQPFSLPFPL